MRGVDGTSRNNKRLDGVILAFQVSAHLVERHIDDPSNVLANNPSGPEIRDNSKHFRPEVTVILLASSLPGNGKRLTGESARNNVNCSQSCLFIETLLRQRADVPPARHVRPVFFQNLCRVVRPLALSDGGKSGPLGGKVKSPDAREEGEMRQFRRLVVAQQGARLIVHRSAPP